MWTDRQTDVRHINLIGGLVTRNPPKILAIMQLEILNILVALSVFSQQWARKSIHMKCDNLAVVQVLSVGKTRDLHWFTHFLDSHNRISYFDHKCIDGTIELDTCLIGFGGCWENFVYHVFM